MPRPFIGVMKGRSGDPQDRSLRDKIINEAQEALAELDAKVPDLPPKANKKKRNHKVSINYFGGMDDIIADSYEKQKAAFEITKAVTQLFESRGYDIPFDSSRFERAAQNMAMVQMMREMSWLFGIGPEHTDRIVDHTIDRLFGTPATNPYKVTK